MPPDVNVTSISSVRTNKIFPLFSSITVKEIISPTSGSPDEANSCSKDMPILRSEEKGSDIMIDQCFRTVIRWQLANIVIIFFLDRISTPFLTVSEMQAKVYHAAILIF